MAVGWKTFKFADELNLSKWTDCVTPLRGGTATRHKPWGIDMAQLKAHQLRSRLMTYDICGTTLGTSNPMISANIADPNRYEVLSKYTTSHFWYFWCFYLLEPGASNKGSPEHFRIWKSKRSLPLAVSAQASMDLNKTGRKWSQGMFAHSFCATCNYIQFLLWNKYRLYIYRRVLHADFYNTHV